MSKWMDIAAVGQVKPGPNLFVTDAGRVLVCRQGDELFASSNACPHAMLPLDGGELHGRVLTCPFHGYSFDLRDGRNIDLPDEPSLRVFPLRCVGDRVELSLDSPVAPSPEGTACNLAGEPCVSDHACEAVLFDLDGTLCDTLEDIASIANHALVRFGQPPHAVSSYRRLAGQGARWLVEHALPPGRSDLVDEVLAELKARQLEVGGRLARPYDGIPELLDALTARGVPLAVLSNKPHLATRDMIRRLFGRWSFVEVQGAQDDLPLKPDPAGVHLIAQRTGIPAQRWLYLGDTDVDMQTARAAGCLAVGALWGFRDARELSEHGAQHLTQTPAEVLGVFDGARA